MRKKGGIYGKKTISTTIINLLLLKGIGSVISIWILDGTAPSFWLLAAECLGTPNPLTPKPKTPIPWPPILKSSLISLANFWNLIKRLSLILQKVTEAEHGAWKSSDRRAAKTGWPEATRGQGAASKRLKRARGLPGRAERIVHDIACRVELVLVSLPKGPC